MSNHYYYLRPLSGRINIHRRRKKKGTGLKWKLENVPLLVFSGLVLEVIYSLPEEGDTEQATVAVFKQQPGGERKHILAGFHKRMLLKKTEYCEIFCEHEHFIYHLIYFILIFGP